MQRRGWEPLAAMLAVYLPLMLGFFALVHRLPAFSDRVTFTMLLGLPVFVRYALPMLRPGAAARSEAHH